MADTGLAYFRLALQEMNDCQAKKCGKQEPILPIQGTNSQPLNESKTTTSTRPDRIQSSPTKHRVDEDYTGAVCLLHMLTKRCPAYLEVLVDASDFEWLVNSEWRISYVGRKHQPKVVRRCDRKYIHRVIMATPPDLDVDHIFHNVLDNRRSRLRVCSAAKNNVNTPPREGRATRFKGVYLCARTGRWLVQCGRRTNRVYLGAFTDEVEAARAYNDYAMREYGEFAWLNPV